MRKQEGPHAKNIQQEASSHVESVPNTNQAARSDGQDGRLPVPPKGHQGAPHHWTGRRWKALHHAPALPGQTYLPGMQPRPPAT